jgi:hypothetical protein
MAIDGPPTNRSKRRAPGGKLRMSDISPNKTGKNVQDVKITGIPLENAKAAIRMAKVRPKRRISEEHKAALLKGRDAFSGMHRQSVRAIFAGGPR